MPLRDFLELKSTEPLPIQVAFDGADYPVQVRRNRQARRYTLRIHAAKREVVLTMPTRGSLREAKRFAEKNGGWIAARLRKLPQPAPFTPGAMVPLRGVEHRIEHRQRTRGAASNVASHVTWTEVGNDGARLLCVSGQVPHVRRRVTDFLKREAGSDLEAASRRHADAIGVTFKRISLRDPGSRWGSCSSTGLLSYSWRLIMAPPFVLDYLAAHEVAHLAEMNHSAKFWRLLAHMCPDIARAKTWLNAHGTDLHRYGSAES